MADRNTKTNPKFEIDSGTLSKETIKHYVIDFETDQITKVDLITVISGKSKDGREFSAKGVFDPKKGNYQDITEFTVGGQQYLVTTKGGKPYQLVLDEKAYNSGDKKTFIGYMEALLSGSNVLQKGSEYVIKLTPVMDEQQQQKLLRLAKLAAPDAGSPASLPYKVASNKHGSSIV